VWTIPKRGSQSRRKVPFPQPPGCSGNKHPQQPGGWNRQPGAVAGSSFQANQRPSDPGCPPQPSGISARRLASAIKPVEPLLLLAFPFVFSARSRAGDENGGFLRIARGTLSRPCLEQALSILKRSKKMSINLTRDCWPSSEQEHQAYRRADRRITFSIIASAGGCSHSQNPLF